MTSTDSTSTVQSHLHLPLGGSHINELIDGSSSASAEDSDASGSHGLFLKFSVIKGDISYVRAIKKRYLEQTQTARILSSTFIFNIPFRW